MYTDVPLGLYLVRGENIVVLGEMVRLAAAAALSVCNNEAQTRVWSRECGGMDTRTTGAARPHTVILEQPHPTLSLRRKLCVCVPLVDMSPSRRGA